MFLNYPQSSVNNLRKILIITEVTYGYGDFFAAKKIISFLTDTNPEQQIKWLVMNHPTRLDVEKKVEEVQQEFSQNVKIELLTIVSKLDSSQYKDTQLILLFPTVHHLTSHNFKQLKNLNVPMLQLYEYDGMAQLHQLVNKSELTSVQTGFAGLGLFLNNIDKNNLLCEAEKIFDSKSKISPDRDAATYFSYLNLTNRSETCNGADFVNYTKVALSITPNDQSVNIITNIPPKQLPASFKADIFKRGFNEIVFLKKNHVTGEYTQEFSCSSSTPSTKSRRLTLINVFPLSQKQMQALMLVCHPLQQVTGDQSLSEVMSCGDAEKYNFPFYQAMYWKRDLFMNWLELSKMHLGKTSKYVKLLSMIQPDKELDTVAFAKTWSKHEEAILADSKKLYQILRNEKNMYDTLPRFLSLLPQFNSLYAKLLAQLVLKLKNNSSVQRILEFIDKNFVETERETVVNALTEFLTLNASSVTQDQLLAIVLQINNVEKRKRIHTASVAKRIINLLPIGTGNSNVDKIIPELARLSSIEYPRIITALEKNNNLAIVTQNPQWFASIVEQHIDRKLEKVEEHPNKSILLAVNVYDDGIGDLVKFIGVYKMLCKLIPIDRIKCLIKCFDEQRPVILTMLRENKVQIKNIHMVSSSKVSNLIPNQIGEDTLESRLWACGLVIEKLALIMSVATPLPEINQFVRKRHSDAQIIELAEFDYASFDMRSQRHTHCDDKHERASMGIAADCAGIEITPNPRRTLHELFSSLAPQLTESILGGTYSEALVEKFQQDTFFMPAYMKYEGGSLSINLAVQLMETEFTDKEAAVVWVHELPFDVKSTKFQTLLRDKGYASLVVHTADNKPEKIAISKPIGYKEFRIICRRVDTKDFDLMYAIAAYNGGIVGCVGQNSFEKAVSFSVLPAFYAPKWQRCIIHQVQGLMSLLGNLSPKEQYVLQRYFELLEFISNYFNFKKIVLAEEVMDYYRKDLLSATDDEFHDLIKDIFSKNCPEIMTTYSEFFKSNPKRQIEEFLANHSFKLLKSAWQKVCAYLQQHRNLSDWLDDKIKQYVPNLASVNNHQPSLLEDHETFAASYLALYQQIKLEKNTFPAVYQLIHSIFSELWPDYINQDIDFILTDSDSYYMEIVAGQNCPAIAISLKLISDLTLDELVFNAKLVIACYKKFPVENGRYPLRKISPNELIQNGEKGLEHGISFCRKAIAQLAHSIKPWEGKDGNIKHDKNEGRYYERKYYITFYQDMIKVLGMSLGDQHKYQIIQDQKVAIRHLPPTVQGESKQQIEKWGEQQWIKQGKPVSLQTLLDIIPQLTIKSEVENKEPTYQVTQFLNLLSQLPLNVNDREVREDLEKLIDLAHQHKFPSFTELYVIVCKKLNCEIIPLGIYKKLQKSIEDLVNARSSREALQAASRIYEFLTNKVTSSLFYEVKSAAKKFAYTIDMPIRSEIGSRINWEVYFDTVSQEQIDQWINWAVADESTQLAHTLFLLGFVDWQEIWAKLTFEFLHADKIFLVKNLPYVFRREIDNTHVGSGQLFIVAYIQYMYQFPRFRPIFQYNSNGVENFIKDNMLALAHPELMPDTANMLITVLRHFLKIDPENAKIFIRAFLLDSEYEYGLSAMKKLRKLFDTFREGMFRPRLGEPYGRTPGDVENMPYINFIISQELDFVSYAEALSVLVDNFSLMHNAIPLSVPIVKLKLATNNLPAILASMSELIAQRCLVTTLKADSLLINAIQSLLEWAIKQLPDVKLLSSHIYDILYKLEQESIFLSGALRITIDHLWKRCAMEIHRFETTNELTPSQLVKFYLWSDQYRAFPDENIRNKFSKILLSTLKNLDNDELKLKLISSLLMNDSALMSSPLSDVRLTQDLIKEWARLQAKNLGSDDGSEIFHLNIISILRKVIANAPNIYRRDMLEALLCNVEAQRRVCEYVDAELNKKSDMLGQLFGSSLSLQDVIVKITDNFVKNGISNDAIEYLTTELTSQSIATMLAAVKRVGTHILSTKYEYVSDENAYLMLTWFYHQYWNLNLELRSVIISNLLMPSSSLTTQQGADEAYQEAQAMLNRRLFQRKDEDQDVQKALLGSYLDSANEHFRPFLLAGVMTASKMSGGVGNFVEVMPKLAEAMGAVGVKAAQSVANFHSTPIQYREPFARLKSNTRIPYRWELFRLIQKRVPEALSSNIARVVKILGGASFYIAVEVVMKNGQTAVLRLLREDAHNEIKRGFAHFKSTIRLCKHPRVTKIYNDLEYIINEANESAIMETTESNIEQQYKIADRLYRDKKYTVKINSKVYNVTINPVDLYTRGEGYQLISKAAGTQFNELKRQPDKKELCQAVAYAVCVTELRNMLSNGPFNSDSHEGNLCVSYTQAPDGSVNVNITCFDFGEVSTTPSTKEQLQQCDDFFKTIMSESLSVTSWVKSMFATSIGTSLNALSDKIIDYIRKHRDAHANKPETQGDELARLRRVFKGLIALNDYFGALAENKELTQDIKGVIRDEFLKKSAMSILNVFGGFFSSNTTNPNSAASRDEPLNDVSLASGYDV